MKKKLIAKVLALAMLTLPSSAVAAEDPRLSFWSGDDTAPYKDGQFFTRYAPWLKSYHFMTEAEVASGAHGGEACQQIRCIDISPVDSNLMIFGSDTSGVWITKDGGDFWYNTNRNIAPSNIADVMCHPTDKKVMLCYPIGTGGGIYRSENMGQSWTKVYTDYVESSTIDKLFATDNSGNIYAVTGHGIIKSTDSGKTWTILKEATEENNASNRALATSINVTGDGKTIIACYAQEGFSLNGINISTNGGTSWSKLRIKNADKDYMTYSFLINPQNETCYLAGIYNSDSEKYELYVSQNKDTSWTKFQDDKGTYNMVENRQPITRMRIIGDKLYVTYYKCDGNFRCFPVKDFALAATASLWKEVRFASLGLDTESFKGASNMYWPGGFDSNGNFMMVCSGGPLKYTFSSDSSGIWERKSQGYSGKSVVHFDMDDEGNLLLSAVDGNIITSSSPYTQSSPAIFNKQQGTYGTTVATMAIKDPSDPEGDRIIAWCGNANTTKKTVGIIISENNGKTWSGYDAEANSFSVLVADPKNYDAAVLEYSAANKNTIITSCATSTKNGKSWEMNKYYYLDISGEKSERILAWDFYGDSPSYKLKYSSDGGSNWKTLPQVGSSGADEVRAFFDAEDENIIWYKQQFDFGKINIATGVKTSFKNYPGASSYQCYNNLVQNPKKPHHLILTTENLLGGYCPSVLESIDYGKTWHVVPGFFGRRTINNDAVKFSTTTDEVFFGSHNGIIVYEYEKFSYYQALGLKDSYGNFLLISQELRDGKVDAPGALLPIPRNYRFEGWIYKDTLYTEGEKIPIK